VSVRIGWGFDVHPLNDKPPVLLGGVVVDEAVGVDATSDGEVAAHAVCDALLGAAALGDLGQHFPSSDPRWDGVSSLDLLRSVVQMARDAEVAMSFVDVTIVAERVRVSPFRGAIIEGLAGALACDPTRVSVKATTTDGLGLIGRGEGLAAMAVVTAEGP
jgi:2-C-methyl-D-erythritol 2,4-cyclodiphosphate synthase